MIGKMLKYKVKRIKLNPYGISESFFKKSGNYCFNFYCNIIVVMGITNVILRVTRYIIFICLYIAQMPNALNFFRENPLVWIKDTVLLKGLVSNGYI